MPASSNGLPTSTTFTAAWVLPIAEPPIPRGHVSCAYGQVIDVGTGRDGAIDLGRVALMPALVNAHTHLELSYLRGRVDPARTFVDWVRMLLALRRESPDPRAPHIVEAAAHAYGEAVSSGTGVFGDVSNTLVTPLLGPRAPHVAGIVFHELIGFRADGAETHIDAARRLRAHATAGVRIGLAPHAPYSVSPALFRAIGEELKRSGSPPTTVHLAEGPEEVRLLRDGSGPWRQVLEELGAWDAAWQPPGMSPVAYVESLGFLGPSVLAVHVVQCDETDVARLAKSGTTVVVCPRSNAHVGAGSSPIEAFYRAGLRVAIGTDSLASAPNLNMFEEMAHVRRAAPAVAARRILESATRVGAEALGCGSQHGVIAAGAATGLIAVSLPDDVVDVEEYLLSGVEPQRVSWVWHPRHDAATA
ncbi:MAG TPA: amidohydrolase family protein [Vicinamibacterales bacterium]